MPGAGRPGRCARRREDGEHPEDYLLREMLQMDGPLEPYRLARAIVETHQLRGDREPNIKRLGKNLDRLLKMVAAELQERGAPATEDDKRKHALAKLYEPWFARDLADMEEELRRGPGEITGLKLDICRLPRDRVAVLIEEAILLLQGRPASPAAERFLSAAAALLAELDERSSPPLVVELPPNR